MSRNDGQLGVMRYLPTASWPNLEARARLLARLRDLLSRHGFMEVETPILSAEVVVDRHIDPMSVPIGSPFGAGMMWLQTSPESHMKRLMAAGAQAIYQVTRAFRAGEAGPLHNAEFTLVEWYRRGERLEQGMQFLARLVEELLEIRDTEFITYEEAFRKCLGLNPHRATIPQLAGAAADAGIDVPAGMSRDECDAWLELLMAFCVQPGLGHQRPTIVYQFPASQAALAEVQSNGAAAVAQRFELFIRGVELANGYYELRDADELGRRTELANQQRARDGKPVLPAASRLLAAMQSGLPECTGVALGFDRLVMLAVGARSIQEVIAFPWERA